MAFNFYFRKYKNFYWTWQRIKQRCLNKNNKDYKYYGARGITVCKKWEDFEGFMEDMLEDYLKAEGIVSIDRIDNNKGYSKENCRWTSALVQSLNRRNVNLLEFNGEKLTLRQWADKVGVKDSTMKQRYYTYKWSLDKCLNFRRK